MTSEDVIIPRTGEYVLISILTSQMTITNVSDVIMFIRFGSASTSRGIPLDVNDSAIVDTDVYIAADKVLKHDIETKVVVTR